MKAYSILFVFAFLAIFLFSGCEDYDLESKVAKNIEDTEDEYVPSPEEIARREKYDRQRKKYNSLLNKEAVMAVVNRFFDAVNREDRQAFLDCMNLDKMLTYYVEQKATYTMEDFLAYLNVKEAHKVFAYYDWTMDPKYSKVFYADEIRGDPNTGYASYNITPKEKYKKLFNSKKATMTMKLKINEDDPKWEIVNMNFPREYNFTQGVNVTIIGKTNWEVWRYYLPIEEYVKFKRGYVGNDEDYYVPPDQYKDRLLRVLQPLEDDRPEVEMINDPFKDVVIPELINDVDNLTGKQQSTIHRVTSGSLHSARDFDVMKDKTRDVIGSLINLIIVSAQDRFNDTAKRNAAKEANSALQRFYGKDKGPERLQYVLGVGDLSTTQNKADAVKIIDKWIELFEKSGWER